jgi:protein-S-isoprenylcysteine O-methyltransferase Ste14
MKFGTTGLERGSDHFDSPRSEPNGPNTMTYASQNIALYWIRLLRYYVVCDASYTICKQELVMRFDFHQAVALPWLVLALFWAITAAGAKRPLRRESPDSRLYHVLLMTAAFALLFCADMRIGQLGWRIVAPSPPAAYIGLGLTLLGAGFAVWARSALGTNWSAAVTVKENHSFVQCGPYRLVRHPIYAGGLLAMLGTAIVYGEAGCFVAVILAFVGWRLKARREEEFMTQQFGDDYRCYQRNVRQLIPFLL